MNPCEVCKGTTDCRECEKFENLCIGCTYCMVLPRGQKMKWKITYDMSIEEMFETETKKQAIYTGLNYMYLKKITGSCHLCELHSEEYDSEEYDHDPREFVDLLKLDEAMQAIRYQSYQVIADTPGWDSDKEPVGFPIIPTNSYYYVWPSSDGTIMWVYYPSNKVVMWV